MRENKDFCSGYFTSFITVSNPKYDLISQNNLPSNIINNYYLKTKNGQYLKQVTNEHSRYNLNYHNNMKVKYQSIRNKHFNKPLYNTCPTKSNPYIINNSPITGQLFQEETRNQPKNKNHQLSLNTETILHTENDIPIQRQTNRNQQLSLNTETTLHIENAIPTQRQTKIMNTPCKRTLIKPRKLFEGNNVNSIDISSIDIDILPSDINLEFLLLNTLKINAIKVQTVVENFIRGKEYNGIFCFTETKG